MTSHEAFNALCYYVNNAILQKIANFYLTIVWNILDLLHLSITSNGLSIEKDTIENPLGVLPYAVSA